MSENLDGKTSWATLVAQKEEELAHEQQEPVDRILAYIKRTIADTGVGVIHDGKRVKLFVDGRQATSLRIVNNQLTIESYDGSDSTVSDDWQAVQLMASHVARAKQLVIAQQ